jgi:hypothetical protein
VRFFVFDLFVFGVTFVVTGLDILMVSRPSLRKIRGSGEDKGNGSIN